MAAADFTQLLTNVAALARRAGEAAMDIYESGELGVEIKHEPGFASPLTKADKLANHIIEAGLRQFTDYPIISEESSHTADDNTFWLVDPIDGTKEFINHNGEFTVNIGLIMDGRPVLGAIYAPAKKVLYFGIVGSGAFKQMDGQEAVRISAVYSGPIPTVLTSRSHINEQTESFLKKLGEHRAISMGSSLKLCLVAEGKATLYPRFSPTYLWDTAAADAVVRAAGGTVTDMNGEFLTYDPQNLRNPHFIVAAHGQSFAHLLHT